MRGLEKLTQPNNKAQNTKIHDKIEISVRNKMRKLTIQSDVTEQAMIEWCLNLKYSGYDPTLMLLLYALGKRWHIDKFRDYWRLLG